MCRMQRITRACCWVLVMAVAALTVAAPATQPTADMRAVVAGSNTFALDLYAKLKGGKGNLFFSPHSLSTALAMTWVGARANTADQMAKVLHFDLEPERLHPTFAALIDDLNAAGKKGDYQLSVANALWGQKGYSFLDEFLDLTNTHYGAGLHQVDFAGATEDARKTINAWVEKQTADKIKDLIKPDVLDSLTRLVLTNAIYFKGNWANQFKKDETKDEQFTLIDGKKTSVPMMNQTEEFKYMQGDDFQALEMPYRGDRLAMTVLLPAKPDGLPAFEKTLAPKNLKEWLPKLRRQKVIVSLPTFKMTCEFSLEQVLASMGMPDAFSLPPADFSGMTGGKDLFIGAVLHKAFVDVNETGTEAAAATAVVMKMTAILPAEPPPLFRADHPFVFLIRDTRTGSILFAGRVMNPKSD